MALEIYTMIGFQIRRMHQISVSIFDSMAAENGINLTQVQFSTLTVLESFPNIDQKTLASLIAYDRVTISGVVERLVRKGYILRETCAHDRRAKVLCVTDDGHVVLRQSRPVVAKIQEAILAGLNDTEGRQLQILLDKSTSATNALSKAPLQILDDS